MSEIDPALLAEMLREALNKGNFPYLTIVSNSMSPLIRRSDQIQLAPIALEQLSPGDIIVFEGPSNLITHRFWGIMLETEQTQLVTRGDRPQHFDKPVNSAKLIGRVICRRRQNKSLNLSQGTGKWLNSHLANLARLEIRLFASAPATTHPVSDQLPKSGGWLANASTNNFFVRFIRRLLYSWAIILTLTISYISFVINEKIEDH
jgi:hypothetical protein